MHHDTSSIRNKNMPVQVAGFGCFGLSFDSRRLVLSRDLGAWPRPCLLASPPVIVKMQSNSLQATSLRWCSQVSRRRLRS